MTPKEKLKNELIQLNNIHKFIGKYLEVMGKAAESCITDEGLTDTAGHAAAAGVKQLVKGYPRKLPGIADDFAFYLELLKRLHFALIMIGVSEVTEEAKQQKEKSIEESLNDLLGFRN